jgi:hypothetical protein
MARKSEVELETLEARPHLILPAHVDPTGERGPTRGESQGPYWRRTSCASYLPVIVELTTEQRILEAAWVLPAYGGVTGWAANHWMGGRRWNGGTGADGTPRDVWLAVGGDDIRPQPGIAVSAERLTPADLVVVDGISVTTAERSTCFEMRYAANPRRAAIVLSMAAYHDLVSVEELAAYAARHSGWTGIPNCRAAIPLAEENCWSPTEVEMVLVWRLDAELPRPLCNRPVFDLSGRHVGTPDLIDLEAGVVGQYHGGLHLAGGRAAVDGRLEERFRSLGLETFTMRAADRADPHLMAERMVASRRRARWEAESRRQWTVDYPSWWTPTHTVELRRALDPVEQERCLRYRAA